jgi:hypothetical protein
MKLDNQSPVDGAPPTQSGRVRRRVLLAGFIVLGVVAIWTVLLWPKLPESDVARVVAVGDLKTDGEHWVLFRFDAPKKRAARIVTVQVSTSDGNFLNAYPSAVNPDNSAAPFPESRVPLSELVKAGKSRQLKVRHVGGGPWRVRLCLMVRLGFEKQYAARIRACCIEKSLKPWGRYYLERNYCIIESEAVSTTDFGVPSANPSTPVSPTPPWSPADEIFSLGDAKPKPPPPI